jgi:hypothetical protein
MILLVCIVTSFYNEMKWLDVKLVNGVVDQFIRCNTSLVANGAKDAHLLHFFCINYCWLYAIFHCHVICVVS